MASKALGYGAAGAAAGSAFGPWGAAAGGIGGAVIGGFNDLFGGKDTGDIGWMFNQFPGQFTEEQKNQALERAQGMASGSGPYGGAAAGARQVSGGFADLANTQWDRMQQGLDKAQGAYAPSQALWNQSYGSPQTSNLNNWLGQNYQQFGDQRSLTQPSNSTGAMQQVDYSMQDPSWTQTAASNQMATLGGNNSQDYYQRMGSQYQQPTAVSSAYQPGNYQQPGAGEDFYSQNSLAYGQNKKAADVYLQYGSQLATPGQSEGMKYRDTTQMQGFAGGLPGQQGIGQTNRDAQGLQNIYAGANNTQRMSPQLEASYQNAAYTQRSTPELQGIYNDANRTQAMSPELQARTRGADDVARFAGQQMPGLGRQGLYEQFVQSDITGRNPLLERGLDQGLARVNQEMARRGHFDSGGAATGIGNMVGQFEAQDYQNRADRAQSAQQMELSRIGQGQSLAGASAQNKLAISQQLQGLAGQTSQERLAQGNALQGLAGQNSQELLGQSAGLQGLYGQMSGERMAQGQAFQGLAGQRDAETMGRLGQQLSANQFASGESLANSQGRLQYAAQGDQARLARLMGLSGMASAGDQSGINALNAQQGAAQNAQAMQLARLQGGMGAANMVDQNRLAMLQGGMGAASTADASKLAQANSIYNMYQGVDQQRLAQQQLYGQLANQSDQQRLQAEQQQLSRLMAGQSAYGAVDTQNQQRMNDGFAARFGLDTNQANLYGQFYNNGSQMYGGSMTNSLNALGNSYGLQAQQQAADDRAPWEALKFGIDAGKGLSSIYQDWKA